MIKNENVKKKLLNVLLSFKYEFLCQNDRQCKSLIQTTSFYKSWTC